MYKIAVSPAVLTTLKRAWDFFHRLKAGSPQTWDDFLSPEVEAIRKEWALIKHPEDASFPELSTYLTGAQLRVLARALSAYVAAQDGRYNLLIDYTTVAFRRHPNPFVLIETLAMATHARRFDRSRQCLLFGLDESSDAEVRNLLVELTGSMTPPGQSLQIDLPAFGIVKLDESEPQPC